MGHITFSIVIPAHNGERFLRSAIESALRQTRPADEVIVVDDASKDKTADIARSSEFSGRIKYYFNEHASGFVDAWNRAVSKAVGDFVAILHQDDLLHPEYLEHMENAVRRYPQVRHLYAACTYIDENNRITGMPPEPYSPEPVLYSGRQYAHNYISGVISNRHIHRCPGVLTSMQLLIKECTYRKEAGHIADDDFFMRVGAYTDVVGISEPLASFRHHAGSETGQVDLLSLKLAEAYLFQAEYYSVTETILESGDIRKINKQAVKFINLLLFQSLLYKRDDWTKQALDFRKKFEDILPGFMEQALPRWARPMWCLTLRKGGAHLSAMLYVRILHSMLRLRDFGKYTVRQR
jgi:glycosyltransferase involved in cell wall biosynthesis